jgi:hypothetical protein
MLPQFDYLDVAQEEEKKAAEEEGKEEAQAMEVTSS